MSRQAKTPLRLAHSEHNKVRMSALRHSENVVSRRAVLDNVLGLAPQLCFRRNEVAKPFHGGTDKLSTVCQFTSFGRLDHMQQNQMRFVLLRKGNRIGCRCL